MPMLFQASLPKPTRVVLVSLFGCGLFVTIAATLRISLVAVEVHDFHAIGFWSVSETFVAIATTNLPAIFVLVRRWLRPWMPLALRTTANSGSRSVSMKKTGTSFSMRSRKKGSALYGSEGGFVGYVTSGRRSLHIAKDNELQPLPGAAHPISLDSVTSPRKSASSHEGILSHVSASSEREHASSLRRSESSRRSRNSQAPSLRIRKQVDIVVVEEALNELGVRQNPARLSSLNLEFGTDRERDARSKPLPSLPGPVYKL